MPSNPLQIVMPMAGAGSRFVHAGYSMPKPLLPVAGIPMVLRALKDLPSAERVVFLVRREHISEYGIDASLLKCVPQAKIVVVEHVTAGQACTVRLAADFLDNDAPVLVAACDSTHVYDKNEFIDRTSKNPAVEAIVWTMRNDARVRLKPTAWGWAKMRLDDKNGIEQISCKVPISSTPEQDHAVTGFFWFRTAKYMNASIDKMVNQKVLVNGEFYMDTVPNQIIAEGGRAEVFQVQKYIGWGTPEDYEDFLLWQKYFNGLK